mmetsp:Transcript_63867/g.138918  ORF Transcript_63867/g.138918 Transcript_63867/m.138918 type:complete len:126 (+) Transcript_63867:277-654(+)
MRPPSIQQWSLWAKRQTKLNQFFKAEFESLQIDYVLPVQQFRTTSPPHIAASRPSTPTDAPRASSVSSSVSSRRVSIQPVGEQMLAEPERLHIKHQTSKPPVLNDSSESAAYAGIFRQQMLFGMK